MRPPPPVEVANGGAVVEFDLPMPSVLLLELVPVEAGRTRRAGLSSKARRPCPG